MNQRKKRAFTLIELLIVVAIIAILAAIAVPNFLEAQIRAKIARAVRDLRTVGNALDMYIVDHNQFPMIPKSKGGGTSVQVNPAASDYLWWMTDTLRVERDPVRHMGNLLSTPIAYIAEVPYDYFNSRQIASSPASWGVRRLRRRISFIFQGDPLGGYDLPGRGFTTMLGSGGGLVEEARYAMESCGPDLRWHSNITAYHYDPSNGTISGGQLIGWNGGRINPKY